MNMAEKWELEMTSLFVLSLWLGGFHNLGIHFHSCQESWKELIMFYPDFRSDRTILNSFLKAFLSDSDENQSLFTVFSRVGGSIPRTKVIFKVFSWNRMSQWVVFVLGSCSHISLYALYRTRIHPVLYRNRIAIWKLVLTAFVVLYIADYFGMWCIKGRPNP